MRDETRLLFIIEQQNRPVGFVRLDLRGSNVAEVSVAVDPAQHRHGIGGAGLEMLRDLARGLRLRAFVKDGNTPSKRLFAGAGYRESNGELAGCWFEST